MRSSVTLNTNTQSYEYLERGGAVSGEEERGHSHVPVGLPERVGQPVVLALEDHSVAVRRELRDALHFGFHVRLPEAEHDPRQVHHKPGHGHGREEVVDGAHGSVVQGWKGRR